MIDSSMLGTEGTADYLVDAVKMKFGLEQNSSSKYPIICMVLSGHQRFDYAQKALKLHCASYVLKPIDKTQLCDKIRHALELKQNQSHQESAASISSIAPAKTAQDQLAEDEDFIFRVRTYIYSNLSDPDLNRSSIAEYLHMSPDYLSYVFHQKFNQTLSAYITSMRIDKAKELLERTNWGMDIIAEKTFVPCAGTTTVNASFPLCKTSPLHSSVNS